ncbi:MAG: hypothetical protein ACREA9_18180 [Pyrinomonadaceae bacterium]
MAADIPITINGKLKTKMITILVGSDKSVTKQLEPFVAKTLPGRIRVISDDGSFSLPLRGDWQLTIDR